jgi:hypothetical protein
MGSERNARSTLHMGSRQETSMMLGLSYIGFWDELSAFNRALNALRITAWMKR